MQVKKEVIEHISWQLALHELGCIATIQKPCNKFLKRKDLKLCAECIFKRIKKGTYGNE